MYSHLFIKHLSFVIVMVSEPYLSTIEDSSPLEVKLSESLCALALGSSKPWGVVDGPPCV